MSVVVQVFLSPPAALVSNAVQARTDRLDHALCLGNVTDSDRVDPRRLDRSVVSAFVKRVADEYHVGNGHRRSLGKFAQAISLVDTDPRNIDRRRSADTDGKTGEARPETLLQKLALGEIRIPRPFCRKRRILPQPRKSQLGSAILDLGPPTFVPDES